MAHVYSNFIKKDNKIIVFIIARQHIESYFITGIPLTDEKLRRTDYSIYTLWFKHLPNCRRRRLKGIMIQQYYWEWTWPEDWLRKRVNISNRMPFTKAEEKLKTIIQKKITKCWKRFSMDDVPGFKEWIDPFL